MNYGISLSALLNQSCKLQSRASKSAAQPLTCRRGGDYIRVHQVHWWASCSRAFIITAARKHVRNVGRATTKKFSTPSTLERPVELFHSKQKQRWPIWSYSRRRSVVTPSFCLKKAAPVLEDLEKILFFSDSTLWRNVIASPLLPKNSHKKHTFSDNPITRSLGAESGACLVRSDCQHWWEQRRKLSSAADVGTAVCI